jgi:FixJ family two-component response regulator
MSTSTVGVGKKRATIGIVDNDPYIAKAVSLLLDAQGYGSICFSSAEEFLRRYATEKLDCLLLDINLDGMSGMDLQRILIARGSALPVIFITGRGDDHTIANAIDLGCVAFLHKPFASSSLKSALSMALGPKPEPHAA